MPWDNDDDDLWDDSDDAPTKTNTPGKAGNDSDSDSSWDDGDDDKAAKPKETAKKEEKPVEKITQKKKTAAKPKKWQKNTTWESESSEEEYVDDGPKRSTKKSKLKKERIRALDRPKAAPKKVKKDDSDSDSDDSSSEEGVQINRFKMTEDANKMAGFGDEGFIKKKKKKKKGPVIPTKVGELYKINNDMSRKDQEKELKRLAKDVSSFILDLAMPAIDQNKKNVAPRLRGWQVKDFICTFINRCALPLDANELSAVRIQAESEIKNLAARERRARKDARNKKPVKKPRLRQVHIEQYENNYVDGQFDGGDFEAFI